MWYHHQQNNAQEPLILSNYLLLYKTLAPHYPRWWERMVPYSVLRLLVGLLQKPYPPYKVGKAYMLLNPRCFHSDDRPNPLWIALNHPLEALDRSHNVFEWHRSHHQLVRYLCHHQSQLSHTEIHYQLLLRPLPAP